MIWRLQGNKSKLLSENSIKNVLKYDGIMNSFLYIYIYTYIIIYIYIYIERDRNDWEYKYLWIINDITYSFQSLCDTIVDPWENIADSWDTRPLSLT